LRRLWQFLLLPAIGALLWSAATTPIQKEVPATYSLLWVAAELLALARIVAWVVDAQRIKLPYKRRAPNSNARGAIAVYMIVFGIVSCFLGTDAYHALLFVSGLSCVVVSLWAKFGVKQVVGEFTEYIKPPDAPDDLDLVIHLDPDRPLPWESGKLDGWTFPRSPRALVVSHFEEQLVDTDVVCPITEVPVQLAVTVSEAGFLALKVKPPALVILREDRFGRMLIFLAFRQG